MRVTATARGFVDPHLSAALGAGLHRSAASLVEGFFHRGRELFARVLGRRRA